MSLPGAAFDRPEAGGRPFGRTQAEFEMGFYGEILQRRPHDAIVLRRQAQLLAEHRRYEEALELDRRLARIRPDDCTVRYNLACTLSLLARVPEALDALAEAVRLGYRDLVHLETDPDLDNLRQHPRFLQVLDTLETAEL